MREKSKNVEKFFDIFVKRRYTPCFYSSYHCKILLKGGEDCAVRKKRKNPI